MKAVGMGWYTPESWARLAAMPEARIRKSYADFVRGFEAKARDFAALGVEVESFDIDVDRMVEWCHRRGYMVDAHGRAAYGAMLLIDPSLSSPIIDNTRVLQ
jgi:hypothetical protein